MSGWYKDNCDSCGGRIFVTFTRADGKESVQTRIRRGAVTVSFHQKQATHSSDHVHVQKTWCEQCAANGLVEFWMEMRSKLLDPNGEDPKRKLKKRAPRNRLWSCSACEATFFTEAERDAHQREHAAALRLA